MRLVGVLVVSASHGIWIDRTLMSLITVWLIAFVTAS